MYLQRYCFFLNKKNERGVSRGEIVDDYLKKLKAKLPHLNDNSPLFLCGKSSFFSKFSYWHWNYSRNTSLDFRISQAEGQKGQKVCVYEIQADIRAMKALYLAFC